MSVSPVINRMLSVEMKEKQQRSLTLDELGIDMEQFMEFVEAISITTFHKPILPNRNFNLLFFFICMAKFCHNIFLATKFLLTWIWMSLISINFKIEIEQNVYFLIFNHFFQDRNDWIDIIFLISNDLIIWQNLRQ